MTLFCKHIPFRPHVPLCECIDTWSHSSGCDCSMLATQLGLHIAFEDIDLHLDFFNDMTWVKLCRSNCSTGYRSFLATQLSLLWRRLYSFFFFIWTRSIKTNKNTQKQINCPSFPCVPEICYAYFFLDISFPGSIQRRLLQWFSEKS